MEGKIENNPTTTGAQEWWRDSFDEIQGEEAIKNCDGAQMFNGKWWMPLFGCDTLDHLNDAHNASITAEREKRTELNNEWQSLDTDRVKEIQQLREQLDDIAKRERACCPEHVGFEEYIQQLGQQLAGVEPELKRLGEIELHYVESQRQLAAAQAEMGRATDTTGISFDSSNDALDAAIDEARQPLVELLEQVLQETVNTPVYPDGPCLNKETRDDIKTELAKVKEGSYPLLDGRTR